MANPKVSENVIRKFIKNDAYVFQLSNKRSFDSVELTDTMWRILKNLDGKKTLADLAKKLSLSLPKTRFSFYHLLHENLVELLESDVDKYLDEDHIQFLEIEFIRILGPVAEIIMEDVLDDYNMTRSTIDKTLIYSFVESVSNEIDDDEKKVEFQKASLIFLRRIMR
jgi:hypothetical protein